MAKKFKLQKFWKKKKLLKLLPLALILLAIIISLVLVTQKRGFKIESEAKVICTKLNEVCNRTSCCSGLIGEYSPRTGECRCHIPPKVCKAGNMRCLGKLIQECKEYGEYGVWESTGLSCGSFFCVEYEVEGKKEASCSLMPDPSPKPSLKPSPKLSPKPSSKPSPYSGSCTKTCVPSLLECTDNDGVRVSGTCSYGKVCCFYPL